MSLPCVDKYNGGTTTLSRARLSALKFLRNKEFHAHGEHSYIDGRDSWYSFDLVKELVEMGLLLPEEAYPYAIEAFPRLRTVSGGGDYGPYYCSPRNLNFLYELNIIKPNDAVVREIVSQWDNISGGQLATFLSWGVLTKEEVKQNLLNRESFDRDCYALMLTHDLLTHEEARPFIEKEDKNWLESIPMLVEKGFLTRDEARQALLAEEVPLLASRYLEHATDAGILTPEEANAIVAKEPLLAGMYFFKDDAEVVVHIENFLSSPKGRSGYSLHWVIGTMLECKRAGNPLPIDVTRIRPLALEYTHFSTHPGYITAMLELGVLLPEHLEEMAQNIDSSYLSPPNNENPLLNFLQHNWITPEAAKDKVLEQIAKRTLLFFDFVKAGAFTPAEAKTLALTLLEESPYLSIPMVQQNILTKAEAKPYALKELKKNPFFFEEPFNAVFNS